MGNRVRNHENGIRISTANVTIKAQNFLKTAHLNVHIQLIQPVWHPQWLYLLPRYELKTFPKRFLTPVILVSHPTLGKSKRDRPPSELGFLAMELYTDVGWTAFSCYE